MNTGIRVVLYAAGFLLLAALHLLRLLRLDHFLLLRMAGGGRVAPPARLDGESWRESSLRPPPL